MRFRLLGGLPGALPDSCRLADGYALEVVGDRRECAHCGGRLRRVRTATHKPVGLALGRPKVRLIHRQCVVCGQADSPDAYFQQVPPGGNYAFDVMVEVGLARFRDQKQNAEIQDDLRRRRGLSLPASGIGLLADSFLDGLAAVHDAHVPTLRKRLVDDGGYAMHVDGTCEPETETLFLAMAHPQGWTLEVAKMATENAQEISKLMRRCTERFGVPLAVVRDLSVNIENAKREAVPEPPDLICHYHFLENVGEKLCEKPHANLTAAVRRLKVQPALRSLRKDLVRASRKGERLSRTQIDRLLSHPEEVVDLEPIALRRFLAYALLRWMDDYPADLQGEYFPFDLPMLAFYRRGVRLGRMLADQAVSLKGLSTLQTMAGHLARLREDSSVTTAAGRLEQAAALFEELRAAARLSSGPDEPLLRGRGPAPENEHVVIQVENRLQAWRDQLQKRCARERDEQKRADQQTVLSYLQKYQKQLVGHVIPREGREPFVACRTNNPAEHRFASTKRRERRRLGTKRLTRQVQAMRPEVLLVCNLEDPEYVKLVLGGSLDRLPSLIARHWPATKPARKQRLAATTDHPIPVTKKQLRKPELLETIRHAVAKAVQDAPKASAVPR